MFIMHAGAVASALRQKINPDVYRSTNILGACERSKPREPFFSTKRSSFDCQDRLGTSISKSRNKRFKLGSLFFAGADCSLAEFCDVLAEAGELKTVVFEPFIYKTDHFTKIGWGQT